MKAACSWARSCQTCTGGWLAHIGQVMPARLCWIRILRSAVSLIVVLITLTVSASTNDHVILISIDGLAGFYLTDPKATLPALRRMAAQGVQADALHVANP